MKLKHWLFLGFAAVGALALLHVYMQHGGIQGVQGLIGLNASGA